MDNLSESRDFFDVANTSLTNNEKMFIIMAIIGRCYSSQVCKYNTIPEYFFLAMMCLKENVDASSTFVFNASNYINI